MNIETKVKEILCELSGEENIENTDHLQGDLALDSLMMVNLTNEISEQYKRVVSDADTMRMLYASHHMKRRDSVLPIIKRKLLNLADKEKELLTSLVDKAEKELENETLELSEK